MVRAKNYKTVYILLKLCRKNSGLFFSGHGVFLGKVHISRNTVLIICLTS